MLPEFRCALTSSTSRITQTSPAPVAYERDDMTTAALTPPHGPAVVLACVPAEMMPRAHRPRHVQDAHDSVLYVVSDRHQRGHLVRPFARGNVAREPEVAAEVRKVMPHVIVIQ